MNELPQISLWLELVFALSENLEMRTQKDEVLNVSKLNADGTFKTWVTVKPAQSFADFMKERDTGLPLWHEARGAIIVKNEKQREVGRLVCRNPGYSAFALTEGEYHNLGHFDTTIDALEAL